jgi:hypothetical protein
MLMDRRERPERRIDQRRAQNMWVASDRRSGRERRSGRDRRASVRRRLSDRRSGE